MHGQGRYQWPDGSSYEGNFAQGDIHGFGRFEWPEGSAYEGTWHKGQMTGQGRYDSRFDGEFLQGRFHRDWHFVQQDGTWLDVGLEHKRAEQLSILEGDASAMTIRTLSDPSQQEIESALDAASEEGLVPFLVADSSFQGSLHDCISSFASSSTVRIRDAAVAKRRHRDYRRLFFDAIHEALLSPSFTCLAVIFDDDFPDGSSVPMPEEWRLRQFLDPFSFPLEALHPKLFNGRGGANVFLPEELRTRLPVRGGRAGGPGNLKAETPAPASGAASPAVPGSRSASPVEGEAAAGEGGGSSPLPPPEPITAYRLRVVLAATALVPPGANSAELRNHLLERYGCHVPLHRTCAVVCGGGGGSGGGSSSAVAEAPASAEPSARSGGYPSPPAQT